MYRMIIIFTLLLTGCATVERGADHVRDFATAHPVVTAIAAGAAAGAIVAAVDDHHHHRDHLALPPNRGPLVPPGQGGDR